MREVTHPVTAPCCPLPCLLTPSNVAVIGANNAAIDALGEALHDARSLGTQAKPQGAIPDRRNVPVALGGCGFAAAVFRGGVGEGVAGGNRWERGKRGAADGATAA